MNDPRDFPGAAPRREAIARNPRRAWPLVVVVGAPVAILLAFTFIVRRFLVGDGVGSPIAMLVALPLLLAGGYGIAVPPRVPCRSAVLLALAAGALVAGFLWDARGGMLRMPDGWTSRLPGYPGSLVEAEACSETSGGASFRTLRGGGRGVTSIVGYERALREAGLPSNRFLASCPALGVDCSSYRAASLEILECYADATKSVVRVRYGAPACPPK